ncbi:MAG TPA: hypothetical protein VKN99_26310 [Polyangia bacterium]|nr:hypothetical protein [Polyangia bacterium]
MLKKAIVAALSICVCGSAFAKGPSPAKVYRDIKAARGGDVVAAHAKFFNSRTKIGGVVASHNHSDPTFALVNMKSKKIMSEKKLGGAARSSARRSEGIKDGPIFTGDVNNVRGGLGDITRRGNVRLSTGDEAIPQNTDFVTVIKSNGKVKRTLVDPTTDR